jgi:hypothetical protein
MKTLKDAGVQDVERVRKRARRQLALGRALPADVEYIVKRCDEIEAKIVSMHELNEYGEED